MVHIFAEIAPWYVAIQLCTVAVLPLAMRFFAVLPDRGLAFAKILGVFLVGVVLWLGTSYGLLRNEFGGALLALGAVTIVSYGFGGFRSLRAVWGIRTEPHSGWLWYVVSVEALFLVAFGIWAVVRAYDPAANHTEQPMDLMFMNSIWTSPTYPPRDAWLAGYPISYYYLGYWLLNTLGHLSSTPPAVAYNVGQASWYGLLLITSFGLGFNLFALTGTSVAAAADDDAGSGEHPCDAGATRRSIRLGPSIAAATLTALFVGVIGNLQVILEWLYARGANVTRLATWLDVNGFPENAQQSGKWYIGFDWWWWRSSRVLADQDLFGNHIEVIDEFPMFSYILGDNHPHVLAMPVAILAIGMGLALFLSASRVDTARPVGGRVSAAWRVMVAALPLGYGGLALVAVVSGGLVFLNTWDYPPYWLLLTVSLFAGLSTGSRIDVNRDVRSLGQNAWSSVLFGLVLAGATLVVYLPYFLTAQSQAGGVMPNLFNPSRLQQVLLLFGVFVPATVGFLIGAWRMVRPSAGQLGVSAAFTLGAPLAFLAVSILVAISTERGRALLNRMALPPEASSQVPFVLERWASRPFTFLLFGLALALCIAVVWSAIAGRQLTTPVSSGLFVVLVTGLAMMLVYLPEFVYLRDNFGTRMNTVFKFYYQSWLLMAVAAAFAVSHALFTRDRTIPIVARGLAIVTLVLAAGAMLFPFAGVYSKTMGFASEQPTLDATRYVLRENPNEFAAVEWVRTNTRPEDVVLEGKGTSYRASYNRISSMTGRATLLGWDGHESQWRGDAYADMAGGRAELLDRIYRTARADEIVKLLDEWDIDYVYVGPSERNQYGVSPVSEERFAETMDLVFAGEGVSLYRRR